MHIRHYAGVTPTVRRACDLFWCVPWEDVMNLESKWLEDFSALAATRSFSQAAERRFVTQPAFSRRIRSLEAALGLTLVNRSRTPIELTAAGQLFLVTAATVVGSGRAFCRERVCEDV